MPTRKASAWLLCCLLAITALASGATIPRKSPEFAITMMDGKQLLMSQYHGKVVVLACILTTCPHCQHTIGLLSKLQTEYAPRGLQVLATAIEDMAKMNVPDFVKKFQPTFPVGYTFRDSVVEYLQHPPMLRMLMPNLVFVDRQGVIQAQYSGDAPFFGDDQEKNLRLEIDKLLKEGANTSAAPRKPNAARASK
jgi:thiol-disulfide isomerase/thioredoxin